MAGKYSIDFVGKLATGTALIATSFAPAYAVNDDWKKLLDNGFKVENVVVFGGENLKDGKYTGELRINVADVDDNEIVKYFSELLKYGKREKKEKEVDSEKIDETPPKEGDKTKKVKEKLTGKKYQMPKGTPPATQGKDKYVIVVKGFEDEDALKVLRAKVETDGYMMLSGDQRKKLLKEGPLSVRDASKNTYVVFPELVLTMGEPGEYDNMVSRLLKQVARNRAVDAEELADKFGARHNGLGLPENVVGKNKERYKSVVDVLEKFAEKADRILEKNVSRIGEDYQGIKWKKKKQPQKTSPKSGK